MKIIHVPTLAGLTAAQLVTLSVNGANTYLGTDLVCAIRAQASGTGTLTNAVTIAEDSAPISEFTPRYLATAVRGAKLAVWCLTANLERVKSEFTDFSLIKVDLNTIIYGTCNFNQLDNSYVPAYNTQLGYALWS
jgi:hypothetical protein